MDTVFKIGDRLVSGMDAQGMRRGEAFEVIGREVQVECGWSYATLTLRSLDDGRELHVVNAQVLMTRAKG
jgi:hypothetical protein